MVQSIGDLPVDPKVGETRSHSQHSISKHDHLLTSARIDTLLGELLSEMQQGLGDALVGLYLYGSLVTGDFNPDTSDIDLLAATSRPIDDREFAVLKQLHDRFAARNPAWDNRIEVQYFSLDGLRTFKTRKSRMAVISPGEPFHVIDAGVEYLLNWYVVQEHGITLFGPSPRSVIDPISRDEFIDVVRAHARQWRAWIQPTRPRRPAQAYAILTLCRALYTTIHGQQVSKRRAAEWAQAYAPEWAPMIADALSWRERPREESGPGEATFPETQRFVEWAVERIAGS